MIEDMTSSNRQEISEEEETSMKDLRVHFREEITRAPIKTKRKITQDFSLEI